MDQEKPPDKWAAAKLAGVIAAVGLAATAIHDYAYRRVDQGTGDYELWGLVTHAGSDMIAVTILTTAAGAVWMLVTRR